MQSKYKAVPPVGIENRTWPDRQITSSPRWCAVDLRDGNQALPNPLTFEQKKEYWRLLLEIGYKEIEVGFPSASKDDYEFTRWLIEAKQVPDDVVISVLAPSRPDLIAKTVESLRGAKRCVVHIYIATSDLHREHVLGKSRPEQIEMLRASIATIKSEAAKYPQTRYELEFSPEEFTDTDMDYGVEVCDFVVDQWNPQGDEKVILNLPATVERRPPNHYADMIELFCRKLKNRARSVISLHAHNDMGCAVAATTLSLQAGGERVEGTLFGHGERTGNVDSIIVALNLQYMGVDTGLNFSNLAHVNEVVTRLTGFTPHPRHPYVGDLVYSAFSGSHQDAIHKCLLKKEAMMETFGQWKIPYLHIDPSDVGRSFEKMIRINSQSGKGGIAHVIESEHGIHLPRWMQNELASRVQVYAEAVAREVSGKELWQLFTETYVNPSPSQLDLINFWPYPDEKIPSIIQAKVEVSLHGKKQIVEARENGPVAAFVAAVKKLGLPDFTLEHYEESKAGHGSQAEAVTFVQLKGPDGKLAIGVGIHANISQAAVKAITSAINKLLH